MVNELPKGANASLSKENPGLRGVVVGVDWDAGVERVLADALTLMTILCDERGKALSQEHVVFFNQLVSADLSTVQLQELMGQDDEQLEIDLAAVPPEVDRIVILVYINEGVSGRRTLGQLRKCTLRVLNLDGGAHLIQTVDLADGLDSETAVALGQVYRRGEEWKFKALGSGYSTGLAGVAKDFGVAL